jgi:regulatory protein
MDLLARREHSLAELREKLAAREFGADEIESALASLARDGLADETRFAESFVASRIRKGQGPSRIRAELVERGVDGETIAGCLADAHDWRALAREVRVKRFGASPPQDLRERARQSRFLEYRGFTAEQIRGCFGGEEE